MVKAHSLLYAIYICLLVSIICGAMLYFFNLYSILNLHYNLSEELYIQNQSTVNFALGNKLEQQEIPADEATNIQNSYTVKPYGLLNILIAQSVLKNDTVHSAHFVGGYTKNKTALYIANFTQNISYHKNVKINGDCYFPNVNLSPAYITNELNTLNINGKKEVSNILIPAINSKYNKILEDLNSIPSKLNENNKVKDSIYFNSFSKPTQEIIVKNNLSNVIIKGNFVLKSPDSIVISKSAILEDVIIVAPKIHIEEGFKGNAQFFATQKILVDPKVTLNYPSALAVKNEGIEEEGTILIKQEVKIFGTVVLFGNTIENLRKNSITIGEKTMLLGNLYCSGKLDLQGSVYGSVYTNKVFHISPSSTYENLLHNFTIDISKKPNYYIDFPLFEETKLHYGIIKKVK